MNQGLASLIESGNQKIALQKELEEQRKSEHKKKEEKAAKDHWQKLLDRLLLDLPLCIQEYVIRDGPVAFRATHHEASVKIKIPDATDILVDYYYSCDLPGWKRDVATIEAYPETENVLLSQQYFKVQHFINREDDDGIMTLSSAPPSEYRKVADLDVAVALAIANERNRKLMEKHNANY